MDPFGSAQSSVADPSTSAVAITPHDTNKLSRLPKAIYVGTGGNITMRGVGDTVDTVWKNVPNSSIIPFRPAYIRATGTTAADMIAFL